MKLRAIIILLFISCATMVMAQENTDLTRQVDVSRNFVPDIERAAKINVAPNMTDTTTLRPEFEYNVFPNAWQSGFGVQAINPARLDAMITDAIFPLYVKAGGGYPGLSLFDLYLTSTRPGTDSYGLFINHTGRYPKIKNDLGEKAKAFSTQNSGGFFGKIGTGLMSLRGGVTFDYDVWSRYGQFALQQHPLGSYGDKIEKQTFMVPAARMVFGHDFSDMSYFNFRVGAGFNYLKDNFDNTELGYDFMFELGKSFGGRHLYLKADYDGWNGEKMNSGRKHSVLKITPRYALVTGKFNMDLSVGVGVDIKHKKDNSWWLLPAADIFFDGTDGYLVPWVTLTSDMVNNSYRLLSSRNPYIYERFSYPGTTIEHVLKGGFRGSVSSVFSYRVYAGGMLVKNSVFFSNRYTEGSTSDFLMRRQKRITAFLAGAELEGRLSNTFSAVASIDYFSYSVSDDYDHAYDRPDILSNIYFKYNHKDKFRVSLGVEITGRRYQGTTITDGGSNKFITTNRSAVWDLWAEAEYSLHKYMSIFVEGRNLAGSKLYMYNRYPDQGVTVSGGVKLFF